MRFKKLTLSKPLILLCLLFYGQACIAWWNEDWQYRKKITFEPAAIATAQALQEDITVLVRLHPANFNFFIDMDASGSDLRFIAGDDQTPLKFHIESYDPLAGIALIWVRVPRPTESRDSFWMYYGNPEAASLSEPKASYSAEQTVVLHLNEMSGLPLDSTAFEHHPTEFSGRLQAAGLIDAGAAFVATSQLILPATPALGIDTKRGNTISFWLKLNPDQATRAAIFQYGDQAAQILLDIDNNRLLAELISNEASVRLDTATALGFDRWYHIALTVGEGDMTLFVDGQTAHSQPVPTIEAAGNLVMGAQGNKPGFIGNIDEIRLVSSSKHAAAFRLAAQGESPEGSIINFGEDEEQNKGGNLAEYFALVFSLFEAIRLEGWIIILLLCAMGIAAIDVIVGKALLLRRAEYADDHFSDGFSRQTGEELLSSQSTSEQEKTAYNSSGLFRIYQAGINEYAHFAGELQELKKIDVADIQAIRASMEVQLVHETDRLNSRLIALTIAVSGGPFLGLLGTVLGVMLTFAAIAEAGDVNVNTIAPGVAAALTTTVMGLIVAIPALFGYNYISGGIGRRVASMEVFIERFISKLTRASSSQHKTIIGEKNATKISATNL